MNQPPPKKRGRKPKAQAVEAPSNSNAQRNFGIFSMIQKVSTTKVASNEESETEYKPLYLHLNVPIASFAGQFDGNGGPRPFELHSTSYASAETDAPFHHRNDYGILMCANDFDSPRHHRTSEGTSKHLFKELMSFERGYPSTTNICCWWCVYPFSGHPIGIPKVYDEKKQTYMCTGCFCSFSCALAYAKATHTDATLLRQMYVYWTRSEFPIIAAPPQSLLDVFGGSLDIVQFRMKSSHNKMFHAYIHPQIPWPVSNVENESRQKQSRNVSGSLTSLTYV